MIALPNGQTRALMAAFTVLVASSLLAVYAVPLYRMFCQVTGYGGTTQRVEASERPVLARSMRVRFDAGVDPALPWGFAPVQRLQEVRIGESALSFYRAVNHSDRPVTGMAVFNVTPHKAGRYFSKIECFCFTEQTLAPGETVDMAVTWFIDPAIAEDATLDELGEITLSYNFFLQPAEDRSVSAAKN